ncbi:Coenzyme F420 hydrogenase/dehydrogenase, beta subunit C-terminal domain [Microbacterium sp. CCNWLW134]|uniref:Coenzyme F420 hydrogenase/dehydrogenase, beta subunit C-terminal domain n=1 Tax=Microbacterium sp. CCNWLW134 TaxID=3122064 RepID=UPI003FA5EEBF
MRPRIVTAASRGVARAEARDFRQVCPGHRLTAPRAVRAHPTFGRYVVAYEGFAKDPDMRATGSSGGVLTALADYIVRTGKATAVNAVGSSQSSPSRAVPVQIRSREDALASAGSRYSPVAVIDGRRSLASDQALVGKPCEVSAATRYLGLERAEDGPILLSFFCAGVPSQDSTTALLTKLGVNVDRVRSLRYRGEGWPGSFVASDADGNTGRLSYEESWGQHLGKTVQWRCKLCPDGTGEHADISVGDFWNADDRGFPVFENAEGNSVVIARSARGAQLLEEAAAAGVVVLATLDLDRVARIQPLQVKRKRELAGRLLGRLLVGKKIPRYHGYHLLRLAGPFWRANLAGATGAAKRSAPQWMRRLAGRRARDGG